MRLQTLAAGIVFAFSAAIGLSLLSTAHTARAADPLDWASWRGPEQNRMSHETGLVDKWNPETGENVLWKRTEAAGISSPIVMNGKVYMQVRYKPDTKEEQEEVICLNADTGKILWENKWNVYLSDVPAERVGWSSVAGDPETGRIYALGVNGYFSCIDGTTGKTVWSRSLGEQFGMVSPYGGRTHPPALFEDLVIINAVMTGWGDAAVPAQRILAFDKNTGEPRWMAHTKERPEDTVFSTPTFTVVDGQAQMIVGSSDGSVWGFQPRTGKPLWNFKLSRRGLCVSPVVVGDRVYITQNEENLDNRTQGALVCFKISGTGDITKTNEVWRLPGVMDGKSTPLVVNGRVYAADDTGNMYIADAETGKQVGKIVKLLGTIVRSSPLWADGKIYLTSTTGWQVMQPTETGVKFLAKMRLPEQDEVSGSLAVSHGKIYVPTGAALYCIGDKNAKPAAPPAPIHPAPKENIDLTLPVAWVQITPCEVLLKPGQKQQFSGSYFNEKGQLIGGFLAPMTVVGPGKFGNIDTNTYTAPSDPIHAVATVVGKTDGPHGEIKGEARIRIVPPLPWKFDFNDTVLKTDPANPNAPPSGEAPVTWVGARYRHKIIEKDGDKVMVKITTIPKGTRSQSWMGPDDMHDYTIQADLRGQHKDVTAGKSVVAVSTDAKPQAAGDTPGATGSASVAQSAADINPSSDENIVLGLPDMGLIAQRYTLDMMGNSQQLQIRSWPPQVARRFAKTIPFHWDGDKWYTVKFSASTAGGKAVLKGKVWPRGEKEPDKWTIEAVDDTPNLQGSPGLFGNSGVSEIYIDNVSVTANK